MAPALGRRTPQQPLSEGRPKRQAVLNRKETLDLSNGTTSAKQSSTGKETTPSKKTNTPAKKGTPSKKGSATKSKDTESTTAKVCLLRLIMRCSVSLHAFKV